MKATLVFLILSLFTITATADDASDCKCWKDFEPEKEGDTWLCRGKINHRIVGCNEEEPPLCTCKIKGVTVVLDLGETACAAVDKEYDSLNCEPENEWEVYYSKHPERRIYH